MGAHGSNESFVSNHHQYVCVCQIAAPDDTFEVKICVEEAAVIVTATKEPTSECTITFTSPVMRDDATEGGKGRGVIPG